MKNPAPSPATPVLAAIMGFSGQVVIDARSRHDQEAEAVAAPAPIRARKSRIKNRKRADAANPQGDAVAGRQVFKKMPGVPFAGARQNHPGSEPRGHRRPQVGRRAELQLFAGHEAGGPDVECGHARRLFDGSPEDRAGQSNAISRPQDRSRPQGRDRVFGGGCAGRSESRHAVGGSAASRIRQQRGLFNGREVHVAHGDRRRKNGLSGCWRLYRWQGEPGPDRRRRADRATYLDQWRGHRA